MKKYYAIGIIILISGLFAYHFYAAGSAEENIDTSIQEITTEIKGQLSVSYSSINVSPFSGDILFTDLNIIRNQDIRRARSLMFDFSYLDFLNISLFGAEYGLKRIRDGKVTLEQVSLTNRRSLTEIKVDSLALNYRGDLWELLIRGFRDTVRTVSSHNFDAAGTLFTFSRPGNFGIMKADTLHFDNTFKHYPAGDSLAGSTSLLGITWTPPASFQDKYRFFIQGFGYKPEAIPFRKASATYTYESELDLLSMNEINLQSELFSGSLSGDIEIDPVTFPNSTIRDASLKIGNLSQQLQNFLSNAEKLFGVRIPMADDQISISITGTVDEPEIMLLDN